MQVVTWEFGTHGMKVVRSEIHFTFIVFDFMILPIGSERLDQTTRCCLP